MKDFLTNIIDLLKENSSSISVPIRTWKKGVLPPLPTFPAISVLPNVENFGYNFSGGKYRVEKEVELQVYIKSLKIKEAREKLKKILKDITAIFEANYTVNGQVYDLYLEVQSMPDPLIAGRDVIQGATIRIHGYTNETKPTRSVSTTISASDENAVINAIYELLKTNKNHENYSIENIKSMNLQSISPKAAFPSVLIGNSPRSPRQRSFAGMDTLELNIPIYIFTKLMDKDWALFKNLDITENIKRILQLDSDLGGRLFSPEIESINYYRTLDDRLGLVYQSTINYIGSLYEPLTNTF